MQDKLQSEPVSPESLARKHESQNPPVGGVLMVAGVVLLTVFICLGIIRLMMQSFVKNRPMGLPEELGIISAPNLKPLEQFPKPTLQIVPQADLVDVKARQEMELNGYGWIDRTSGVVRIPIHRAMELLVQRGLPATPTNQAPAPDRSPYDLIKERSQNR